MYRCDRKRALFWLTVHHGEEDEAADRQGIGVGAGGWLVTVICTLKKQ